MRTERSASGMELLQRSADMRLAGFAEPMVRHVATEAIRRTLQGLWLDDMVADARLSVWAMFRQAEWGNERRWWDAERARHADRVAFNLRTFGQTTIPR
jgi:hypothetical protein